MKNESSDRNRQSAADFKRQSRAALENIRGRRRIFDRKALRIVKPGKEPCRKHMKAAPQPRRIPLRAALEAATPANDPANLNLPLAASPRVGHIGPTELWPSG